MKLPVIIDCDPGHDDVMAILLGAWALDVKGITTVHGNAPLSATTANARKLVELADLTHIPIAEGAARPLIRPAIHAPSVHGESGMDGPVLPDPSVPILEEHAADFIYRMAQEVDGLHLAPIGPLTNIAIALRRYPALKERIAGITIMGGSLTVGNSTPAAEFNIWADPEAAHIVFESGIPLKMVGLNVTHQVPATPEYREKIRAINNRTAKFVSDVLDFYSGQYTKLFGRPGGSMHDPVAVAALIDPDVVGFAPMHVAVELRGELTYGMTLCDYRHFSMVDLAEGPRGKPRGKEANAEVAITVNVDRFWELFLDALASFP
jgi:pyrimidine-specific ribonucleoside hydrolase